MATKNACSSAKAVITRKVNEIVALMTNNGNVEKGNIKSVEVLEAFDKFQAIREAFHKDRDTVPVTVGKTLPISLQTSGPIARKLRNLAYWY